MLAAAGRLVALRALAIACARGRIAAALGLVARPGALARRRRGHGRLVLLPAQRRIVVRVGSREVETLDRVRLLPADLAVGVLVGALERHLLGAIAAARRRSRLAAARLGLPR